MQRFSCGAVERSGCASARTITNMFAGIVGTCRSGVVPAALPRGRLPPAARALRAPHRGDPTQPNPPPPARPSWPATHHTLTPASSQPTHHNTRTHHPAWRHPTPLEHNHPTPTAGPGSTPNPTPTHAQSRLRRPHHPRPNNPPHHAPPTPTHDPDPDATAPQTATHPPTPPAAYTPAPAGAPQQPPRPRTPPQTTDSAPDSRQPLPSPQLRSSQCREPPKPSAGSQHRCRLCWTACGYYIRQKL